MSSLASDQSEFYCLLHKCFWQRFLDFFADHKMVWCALFTPFRIVGENDLSLISKGNLITQTSWWIWHLAPRKNWEKSNLRINRQSDIFRLSAAEGKLKPQFSLWRLGTMADVDWIPNPTKSNKCPSRFTIC